MFILKWKNRRLGDEPRWLARFKLTSDGHLLNTRQQKTVAECKATEVGHEPTAIPVEVDHESTPAIDKRENESIATGARESTKKNETAVSETEISATVPALTVEATPETVMPPLHEQ